MNITKDIIKVRGGNPMIFLLQEKFMTYDCEHGADASFVCKERNG